MANPLIICDPNTLAKAAACFGNQCLGPDDRESIETYANVQELAAIGGTNYTGAAGLAKLLVDAKSWQRLDEDTRRAINLYLTIQNAIGKGASFPTDVNSLRKNSACYLCVGWETRKNVKLYLKCLLNQQSDPD